MVFDETSYLVDLLVCFLRINYITYFFGFHSDLDNDHHLNLFDYTSIYILS